MGNLPCQLRMVITIWATFITNMATFSANGELSSPFGLFLLQFEPLLTTNGNPQGQWKTITTIWAVFHYNLGCFHYNLGYFNYHYGNLQCQWRTTKVSKFTMTLYDARSGLPLKFEHLLSYFLSFFAAV